MTINQSNKERMGSSTLDTLNAGRTIWEGSEVFTGHVDKHEANLIKVREWRDKQEEAREIPGLTRDKYVLRRLTTVSAIKVVAACKSLAADTNNQELSSGVNYNESGLNKKKENSFVASCRQIHRIASEYAAALVPYGITAAMLTSLNADINAFETIHSKTRTKRTSVTVFTKNLKAAVTLMMEHLRFNMDFSIKQWSNFPDFIEAYTLSRKIVNYGNTHTGMRGTITDAQTGMKLKNILVEIVEIDKKCSTGKNGVYYFGSLPFGKYTVRLRAEGYIPTEIPDVQLHDGKLMDMDFTLMHEPRPALVPVNA